MKIFYDDDADISIIQQLKVTIVGYGSQGHAHANNLHESGVDVTVALREHSTSWKKAQEAGLKVAKVSDAIGDADLVMILAPDEFQQGLYESEIKANLKQNAVLAFAREGYTKSKINILELAEILSYKGFLKLAIKYWSAGAGEMWRSFSKAAFVQALQRLIPEIKADDLESAPAGIRAQAVMPNGKLLDDFLIQQNMNIINVCNAPSPAATSSLNIGKHIVEIAGERFGTEP